MIFRRKGTCSVCGCTVEIARYDSLARVFKRIDEMTGCPNCGCVMSWKDRHEKGEVKLRKVENG